MYFPKRCLKYDGLGKPMTSMMKVHPQRDCVSGAVPRLWYFDGLNEQMLLVQGLNRIVIDDRTKLELFGNGSKNLTLCAAMEKNEVGVETFQNRDDIEDYIAFDVCFVVAVGVVVVEM